MTGDHRFRPLLAVVMAAGTGAALVSCGDGRGADRADPGSFNAAATKVCQRAGDQLAAIPPPGSLRELAHVSASTSAIAARASSDLRAITVVPADRRNAGRLVAAIDGQARLMRGVERSILADRRPRALRLVQRGRRAEARASASARALGVRACSTLSSGAR